MSYGHLGEAAREDVHAVNSTCPIMVYYREEEPGCEVYYTNSFEYFPERYFLDSYDAVDEPYFETIEEAAECVSGIVRKKVEANVGAITDALDEYTEQEEKKGNDVFFSFHEFTVVND